MLINLEFASGAIGQLLASFGTPATQAPWLELHFERGTISFPAGSQYDRHAGPSIYVDDDSPLATAAHPPLTSVRQPMEQLGREMALLLLALINGDPVATSVMLPTELVVRETT